MSLVESPVEALIEAQHIMATDPRHARGGHAPDYEDGAAFIIDDYVPLSRAAVPITDLGFNRGDAVYDVVSVSRGMFFRLADHQERFAASCDRIRVTNPFSRAREAEILNHIVALTGRRDVYVWFGVTRGKTPMNSADRTNPAKFSNRYYAYVLPYIFIANDEMRARGANAIISRNYLRIPPKSVDPTAKNLHGLDFSQSLFEAGDAGAEWSILTDGQGNITEAPGSNLFLVKGDKLITPAEWCLLGITRKTALELGQEIGMSCEVRPVSVAETLAADEVFYTSSAGGIMPLNSIDGTLIGGVEGPGPITARLHNLYWEKRWAGWHGVPVDYSVV
ncbi:aminotransferase class IV [Mameliella alba]|nr:aminotransferase class IV [Antarctobacter heliothermus]MBY6145826.1 aminotransferase class IV [Mameliella alba]MCA0954757.1 aminotransferase class IV [Mameliella alba]